MKKRILLLTAVMAMFAFNILAQRTIDWSVESINVPPTSLISKSDNSGSDFIMQAILKNNGTDTVKTTDSILYRMYVQLSQTQLLALPGPSNFFLIYPSKVLAPNDTMTLNENRTITYFTTTDGNTNVFLVSYLVNRNLTDSVKLETSATSTNNEKTQLLLWKGNGNTNINVETLDIVNNEFYFFPNPSTGSITVNTLVKNSNPAENNIRIYDINGRVVLTKQLEVNMSAEKIDVNHLNNGIYFVEYSNGFSKSVSKLQISK